MELACVEQLQLVPEMLLLMAAMLPTMYALVEEMQLVREERQRVLPDPALDFFKQVLHQMYLSSHY